MFERVRAGLPLISTLVCSGCANAPEPAPQAPVASETSPPAETQPLRWSNVTLDRVPAELALYDVRGWRARSSGSFTALEHSASNSTLALRLWRAARLVRPGECEAEARLVRPELPRADAEAILDRRPLEAPQGFHGELVLGVEPASGDAARGWALAVGAAVGRCFVLVFETTANGVDATQVVAERLEAVGSRLVPSVRVPGVDERVKPERVLK